MAPNRRQLDELVARRHGVVTVEDLLDLGYRPKSIESLVTRRQLVPMLPGVYRSPAWPPGERQRLLAICRRSPHAVISHTTAGQVWRIRKMSGSTIRVLTPHRSSPELPGVTVHRCRRIDPVDIVVAPDGVRLTSPPRTLFDASSLLGAGPDESALEQVLDRGMCTLATVAGTVERLARGGRPGSAEMRLVLCAARPGRVGAIRSRTCVVQALRRHGLPEPHRQFPIRLPNGRLIHPDLAYPAQMLAIEIDHPFWHLQRIRSHRDKVRDRQLTRIGWRTIRITDWDVESGLEAAIDDIRHTLGVVAPG
ncbi:MAG: hypothetical protein R2715_00555 [Ilumatobacteraceae bacterium]